MHFLIVWTILSHVFYYLLPKYPIWNHPILVNILISIYVYVYIWDFLQKNSWNCICWVQDNVHWVTDITSELSLFHMFTDHSYFNTNCIFTRIVHFSFGLVVFLLHLGDFSVFFMWSLFDKCITNVFYKSSMVIFNFWFTEGLFFLFCLPMIFSQCFQLCLLNCVLLRKTFPIQYYK